MFPCKTAEARTPLRTTLLAAMLAGLAVVPRASAQPPPIRLPETVVPGEIQEGAPPPATELRRPSTGEGPTNPNAGTSYDTPFASPPTRGEGYAPDTNTTGAKVNLPNIEFPGTVSIVPTDLIVDQQDYTTQQALRNVAGVNFASGAGGRSDNIFIRGFNVGFFDSFRKDGLVDRSRVERDLSNVDRIEVLKGPSSFLYGNSASPSGIINYVLKQPLATPYRTADVQVGYYDFYRISTDMTGPISNGSPLLYRLNVEGILTNSFRDYIFTDRFFIAPAFTRALGENTLVTFQSEYLYDRRTMDRGVPFFLTNPFGVPSTNYLGEPRDHETFKNGRVSFLVDHRFDEKWALHIGYASSWSHEDRDNIDTRNLTGPLNATLTRARVIQSPTLDSAHDICIDMAGKFQTGYLKHYLLFGSEFNQGVFANQSASSAVGLPINIINPKYGQPIPFVGPMIDSRTEIDQVGFYAQDLIDVSRYFKFLVGARYTMFYQHSFNQTPAAGIRQILGRDDQVWTPHYGLLFAPIPDKLTAYVAYGESFQPVLGFTRAEARAGGQAGSPLLPETGNSVEYGIKFQPTKRLHAAFAWYDINRQNITQADPIDNRFSIQIGNVISRGYELEVGGYLLERFSLVGSYSHLWTDIAQDTNRANLHKRLASVPNYTGNLWARYDLIKSEGLTAGFAVGMYTVGNVFGDNPNLFLVPSFCRWDSGLYLRMGRLDCSMFIENLGNINYIASVQSNTLLQGGAPFNLRGMLRWSF